MLVWTRVLRGFTSQSTDWRQLAFMHLQVPPPTTTTGSSSMQCPWYLLQAKSTRDPIDLEDMFEQKLAELQRVNTTDGLKENEKYVELLEHIQNAVESAGG